MNPIELFIQKKSLLVLDGAMATELERFGCDLKDSLWSAKVLMENPELIKKVHMDYFKAGADCTTTASYQGTIEGFIRRGLKEDEALSLIQASVQIALEAREEFWANPKNHHNRIKPIVAASIGPYGAFLADGSEYRGDYTVTEDELIKFHRPRMKALIEAGADVLACETIPSLMEAKAIVSLLKEFPDIHAWICFSAKDGRHISDGSLVADCAEWLDNYEQIAAIGVNCTPPQYIPSLIKEIKSRTKKQIVVYPNLGEEYDPETKTWHSNPYTEQSFGDQAAYWYECGATLIGGCCRTSPDDIKSIVAKVRGLI